MFHTVNRGKRSITLNTIHPEAVELARRLTAECDVVIENFSPGVMQRLGLGYDTLSRDNPRLVMASITSNGQTGPLRDLRLRPIHRRAVRAGQHYGPTNRPRASPAGPWA